MRIQGAIGRRWHGHPLMPREPMRRRDKLHFPVAFSINGLLGRYRKARLDVIQTGCAAVHAFPNLPVTDSVAQANVHVRSRG